MVAVWRSIFKPWTFLVWQTTFYPYLIFEEQFFARFCVPILAALKPQCFAFLLNHISIKWRSVSCKQKFHFFLKKGHTLLRARLFVANLNHFQNTCMHAWHIFFLFYHLLSQKSLQSDCNCLVNVKYLVYRIFHVCSDQMQLLTYEPILIGLLYINGHLIWSDRVSSRLIWSTKVQHQQSLPSKSCRQVSSSALETQIRLLM